MLIIYVSIDIFSTLISAIYSFYTSKITYDLNMKLTLSVLDKALSLKMEDFENTETFNMINRAVNQGNSQIITFLAPLSAQRRRCFQLARCWLFWPPLISGLCCR